MFLLVFGGAIARIATAVIVLKVFSQRYVEILAIFLAVIAALYVGPTIGGGQPAYFLEFIVALLLIALCVYAVRGSLLVLAAGYALHGLWDLAHGPLVPHVLPVWYAPLCVGYDIAVAACIVYFYFKSQSSELRS